MRVCDLVTWSRRSLNSRLSSESAAQHCVRRLARSRLSESCRAGRERRPIGTFDMSAVIRTLAIGIVPDLEALRSLLEVRRVFEIDFFPQAALKLSAEDIGNLRSLADTMQM